MFPLTIGIFDHYFTFFKYLSPILWSQPPVIIHPVYVRTDWVIYDLWPVKEQTWFLLKLIMNKLVS